MNEVHTLSTTRGSIREALQSLQEGRFVLLYDADGREEETDLVVASQHATPQALRILRTDGGGLVCATLHPRVHQSLGLPYMSDLLVQAAQHNPLLARLATAPVPYEPGSSKPSFTVSINHRNTFTGITDNDRSLTLQTLSQIAQDAGSIPNAKLQEHFAREFKSPGHVFLLNAHPGLLSARRGHTELATALMELAGLSATATICEMMNGPSGKALPKADAIKYAAQNDFVFLEGSQVLEAWNQTQNRLPLTPLPSGPTGPPSRRQRRPFRID